MSTQTWIFVGAIWCIPIALVIIRKIQLRRRRSRWKRPSDAAFAKDIRDRARRGQL